jgi:preprotein translocase subunit SecE
MKKYIKENIKLIITIIALISIPITLNILTKNNLIVLLSVIITSTITIFLIKKNNKMLITEIKSEIKNITWPNKKEINQSMLTVTIIIILTSLIIWIVDSILTFIISKII